MWKFADKRKKAMAMAMVSQIVEPYERKTSG
eukprot:COSAG01_NODE_559_length_15469_cov_11.071308_2_plen_31_part_00